MKLNMRELKKLRKKYFLTQYDVAICVGVSDVAYRTWERGVRYPREKHIDKLKMMFTILSESPEEISNREDSLNMLQQCMDMEVIDA